ncbi:PH domain-containing protein [Actinorugispora endophytica]|uniref:Putative membrane protein n=1 Tax=Actinorugispora endophytica TaxID=1605990 RepID=A0A4R6UQN4_9ACTN|nr:PH domain-containing protein [Actinorugispora endophytica]TDQ49560.1 putative membrane protein [Actinorugispora endophytica]
MSAPDEAEQGRPHLGDGDGPRPPRDPAEAVPAEAPEGTGSAPVEEPGPVGALDGAEAGLAPDADRRLSPLTVVTASINHVRSFIVPIVVALVAGSFNPWVLGGSAATLVALVVTGFVTYKTVRYRVSPERLEIRSGLVSRSRRTIPLERIRGVDITSTLLHRVFGLAVVKIEAAAGGGGGKEEGKLDAVTAADAERLRVELLRRRALLTAGAAADPVEGGPEAGEAPEADAGADPRDVVYFRMPNRWYLYAVLSLGYLLTPFAALAALFGFLSQLVDDDAIADYAVEGVDAVQDLVRSGVAVLLILVVGAAVLLLVAMPLFAVGSYLVSHWKFTLRRHGDALVTERGLLTRHSVTLEHRRIRGHELSDNPMQRMRSLVRLSAIVTGLGESATRAALLPMGPRAVVDDVLARALRPFEGVLTPHPPAARSRRLFRAVVPPAVVAVAAALSGFYWVAGAFAVLALLGVPLGLSRYRALGHGYDGHLVSVRSGSLSRTQASVRRDAVIGWRWEQSLFQRRAGLATVKVTVGAGSGGYDAVDADFAESVAFAHGVTPGMVRQFLEAGPGKPEKHEPPREG